MENDELVFGTRAMFRAWLQSEGTRSDGIWLIFAKTDALKTLSAHDALEEALCFGWIDGQMQSIDDDRYKKYFSRRRAKSNWSEKNKELVQNLIEKGLMAPQGLDAISCAKQNGQWDNSKRNVTSEEQIVLFKRLVEPYEPAYTNLSAMSNSVQRTYTLFYFDAKSDNTRQTRLEKIIDRLNKNLKPM
jgi:uncharacterized protein YdeI (YjbR/CyaY-like superfamily)